MHHRSGVTSSKIILGAILIAILAAIIPPIIARFTAETPRPIADLGRPAIHVEFDKVRPRLPYRMISFHRGRGDKRLIRLAHDLGFNGVQFQIEGSTVDGIKDFAKRDSQEHLVDFCHNLGMEVTVWVHEMSDLPPAWMPDWLGPVTTENQPLWKLLDDRYEWVLRDAIPNVDGLALTVVETQVRATNTQVMLKLAALLQDKCKKYNKSLMVRTFVWFPEEFENVMAAVNQLPSNMVIMSKCVPQDWNLRGMFASEIGKVGGRPQIIEYDVAGEYFRRNFVANCMPERLKAQFDAEMKTNISGICVRVDREDDNVLNQPNEMNLWTLGMLADGATDNLDEIWNAWARNRFGPAAADGVVRALKTTGDVVSEMLSVGPFSFGDNRKFPQIGDEDIFGQLHQNWWWDDSYAAVHMKGETGDPAFTAEVASAKEQARQLADQSLRDLDLIRDQLAPQDYSILKTRLLSNRVQLGFRADGHGRAALSTHDERPHPRRSPGGGHRIAKRSHRCSPGRQHHLRRAKTNHVAGPKLVGRRPRRLFPRRHQRLGVSNGPAPPGHRPPSHDAAPAPSPNCDWMALRQTASLRNPSAPPTAVARPSDTKTTSE